MKKVFEGMLGLGTEGTNIGGDWLDEKLDGMEGRRVRITVEDLSESKPEPKNCGNCGTLCGVPGGYCDTCTAWTIKSNSKEPKAAEPQSWEQKWAYLATLSAVDFGALVLDIRAEIERVREEEKQMILEYLARERCAYITQLEKMTLKKHAKAIEQNKHREIK